MSGDLYELELDDDQGLDEQADDDAQERADRVKEVHSHREQDGHRLNILDEKCATCIFRPGNLMHLGAGRVKDLVDACTRRQGHIICHDTLADGVDGAICRGFFDAHPHVSQIVRIAQRMRAVRFIPPPAKNPTTTSAQELP